MNYAARRPAATHASASVLEVTLGWNARLEGGIGQQALQA
jgi:hypothetical protein